jgi:hypothetical protein
VLIDRLIGRQASSAVAEEAIAQAESLEATSFADVVLDTTEGSVSELARSILTRMGSWPGPAPVAPARRVIPTEVAGPILWLWGPTGVGKSTIGFQAYLDLLHSGVTAAYVDVDQIGFCRPAGIDHRLRARNLAAVWSNCRQVGAEALVVVGPITEDDVRHYKGALPNSTFTWCGLGASPDELTRRILSRQAGGSWPQPGDPLRGRSKAELLGVAERTVQDGIALVGPGSVCIDTDRLSVAEAAGAVLDRWDRTRR